MKLLLGSHVRDHGRRVGQLAGFELEPADRRIRRIIFSPDGELGPQAMTRPLAQVSLLHDEGMWICARTPPLRRFQPSPTSSF